LFGGRHYLTSAFVFSVLEKNMATDETTPKKSLRRRKKKSPIKTVDTPAVGEVIAKSSKTKSTRRKKNKRPSKVASAPLLCFDTETTNHGELLELSIFDIHGRELYHQYFRPKAKTWPSDIHHITPDMVADCKRFAAYRNEISRIISKARFFVGCALSNDLTNLRRHGVTIEPNRHTIIETQNWYWLLNDTSDRKNKNQTGLAAMAEAYDVSFGDTGPHSATADTCTTLEVFHRLARHFDHRYPDPDAVNVFDPSLDDASLSEALHALIARFNAAYAEAMHIYRMRNAGGYVCVVRRENGYSIKSHHDLPPDKSKIVLSVPVGDRKRAEVELRQHFEPIQLKGFTGIFDMTEDDFEYVRNYTNDIDIAAFITAMRNRHRRRARHEKKRSNAQSPHK